MLAIGSVSDKATQIIAACLLLMAMLVVFGIGWWIYRRRMMGQDTSDTTPWTLDDLRRLREEGELSETEYQTLRATIIGSLRADKPAGRDVSPSGGRSSVSRGPDNDE